MSTISNEDLKRQLSLCTRENTSEFTFNSKIFLAKCVSVYDGDTITVAFKPFCDYGNNSIYRYNIRLSGVDTPEIRTRNKEEKARGIYARDLLREKY